MSIVFQENHAQIAKVRLSRSDSNPSIHKPTENSGWGYSAWILLSILTLYPSWTKRQENSCCSHRASNTGTELCPKQRAAQGHVGHSNTSPAPQQGVTAARETCEHLSFHKGKYLITDTMTHYYTETAAERSSDKNKREQNLSDIGRNLR